MAKVKDFDKTAKMVPEEVETPEFLNKTVVEEEVSALTPREYVVNEEEAKEVGKKLLQNDFVTDTEPDPIISVDPEGFLQFHRPLESIWLKSRGGVEYQLFATDHGLAVLGRGKLVALLADDEPAVAVNPTVQSTNREKVFKPRG